MRFWKIFPQGDIVPPPPWFNHILVNVWCKWYILLEIAYVFWVISVLNVVFTYLAGFEFVGCLLCLHFDQYVFERTLLAIWSQMGKLND